MKYLYSFLLIILFLSSSCNRSKTTQEVTENIDSLKISTNRIVSTIGETLIPLAKKGISTWGEYQDVDEFMIKYYNITNTEALDNAKELSGLVLLMKDSIRVEKLKELNVIARLNVLYNETLRLADMATISSITDEEIKEEVVNIVEIYSSVNSKINTIFKAEELQNSLEVDTETPNLILEKEAKTPRRNRIKNRKPTSSEKLGQPKKLESGKIVKPATLSLKKTKQ